MTTDRESTNRLILGIFSRTFTEIVGRDAEPLSHTGSTRQRSEASSKHGSDRAGSEKRRERGFRTIDCMYNAISRSQIFVLDQDEALNFYVNVLGLEVVADVDLGFMRWLTVRPDAGRRARSGGVRIRHATIGQ